MPASETDAERAARYDEILRRIAEETEALPRATPTRIPPLSFITYRTKNPDRYDSDQRRAHFLKRVREEIPEAKRGALAGYGNIGRLINDAEQIEKFASPYEPRTEDHPLWNTMVWAGSLPSAIYSTGQMIANEVDPVAKPYPKAYDQFAKSVNTFTTPLDAPMMAGLPGMSTESLGALPKNMSRWRDLQDMRDQMTPDWKTLDPRLGDMLTQAAYSPDILDGQTFLQEAGVPETPAKIGGALMDITIDPLTGFSAASKLSRLGRHADAWKTLGVDFGLGALPTAIPAAADAGKKVYDSAAEIRRLLGVDY